MECGRWAAMRGRGAEHTVGHAKDFGFEKLRITETLRWKEEEKKRVAAREGRWHARAVR